LAEASTRRDETETAPLKVGNDSWQSNSALRSQDFIPHHVVGLFGQIEMTPGVVAEQDHSQKPRNFLNHGHEQA
jgi:hypothetical protein